MEGAIVQAHGSDHEDGQIAAAQEDSWKDFQMLFGVASIMEFEQRAYLDTAAEGSRPEWLYIRLHTFCAIATEPWKFLKQNMSSLQKLLGKLQCPESEIHYRGNLDGGGSCQCKEHTLNSRGYLILLLLIMSSRPLKHDCKQKALRLLLGMIELAFMTVIAAEGANIQLMLNIIGADRDLIGRPVTFDAQGALQRMGRSLEPFSWSLQFVGNLEEDTMAGKVHHHRHAASVLV